MNQTLRTILIATMALCSGGTLFAQGVTIGANNPPDPAAVLDLQSSNQGLLLPRLTTAQRNAISNPPFGLQIYNTDTDCVEGYFALGGWKPLNCGCTVFPDATFNVPGASVNSPATITANTGGLTYSWTFQSGSPATSTTQSTQVTWANAGTYTITLIATDQNGCSSTQTSTITVTNCTPFTQTFTNCSATGRFGPDQNQCDAAYGGGVVTVSNGTQAWTVPQTGTYRIEAAGAQGGTWSGTLGGLGANMQGEFNLTQGTVLNIMVGQQGTGSGNAGGGGGGSGVYTAGNNCVIAAGGGGGASTNGEAGKQGLTTTSGGNSSGAGGTGGNGGGKGFVSGDCGWGSGGGGFTGSGFGNTPGSDGGTGFAGGPGGGLAAISAGTGGVNGGCNFTNTGLGGFGFGGGGHGVYGGGGGGGYSGGGGGQYVDINGEKSGGGGGSFNSGTNQTNQAGINSGNGFVTITFICP